MDSIGSMGRWIVVLLEKIGGAKVRDGELVFAGRGKEEIKDEMCFKLVMGLQIFKYVH